MRRVRSRAALAGVGTLAVLCAGSLLVPASSPAQSAGSPTVPILGIGSDAPPFIGEPAEPRPVKARGIPGHPFMAPNGRSNLHNDAFQSDSYRVAGPLGNDPAISSTLYSRECASVAFDSRGRIVTICVGLDRPVLALLDPVSLDVIADMPLPPRQASTDNPFTDFSGGGYFYLDHRDRAVIPTTTGQLLTVAVRGDEFEQVSDVDLTPALGPDAKVLSALPDWRGNVWFAAASGIVGFVDRDGELRTFDLGERISNSFAVGQGGGVFVVSDAALYRLEARDGEVRTVWRKGYANDGVVKSGQTSPGSGTTPTLLRRRYVAITDNADPVNVVVFDRRREPSRRRLVCTSPVFEQGASSTDQSLIGIGRALIAENNHGYEGPSAVQAGRTTTPGLERIDIKPVAKQSRDPAENCRRRWHSDEIAPSVVPKVSLKTGLVYTYTKPEDPAGDDPWYLTAIDFRSGETRFSVLVGDGLGFNNNYAPVTLGPDGTAYVGVLGGLVRIGE